MAEENQKIVEKYYIEVNPSAKVKFINGLLGGLGWGVGLTIGTAFFLAIMGYAISRVDFAPIIGQFFQGIIESSQQNLETR